MVYKRFVNSDGTEIKIELDNDYNHFHVYGINDFNTQFDKSRFWRILQEIRVSVQRPRNFLLFFYCCCGIQSALSDGFYKQKKGKEWIIKYGWTEFHVRYDFYKNTKKIWTVTFQFGSMSCNSIATIANEIRSTELMKPFRKEPIFFEESNHMLNEESLLSEMITNKPLIIFSNKPNDDILFF
jgi:hypothetical protein